MLVTPVERLTVAARAGRQGPRQREPFLNCEHGFPFGWLGPLLGKDTCRHGSAVARNDVSRLTRAQRLGEDQIAKS